MVERTHDISDQEKVLHERLKSKDKIKLNRLRELCPAEHIPSVYVRTIVTLLFPKELRVEGFDPESVDFSQETKLTHEGQKLRRSLMWMQGYKERRKAQRKAARGNSEDISEFQVFFRGRKGTLLDDLNHLPIFEGLNRISQVNPLDTPSTRSDRNKNDRFHSRADHSKHLAKIMSYSLFRLAINDPAMFLEKVKEDLTMYSRLYKEKSYSNPDFQLSLSKKEKKKIKKFLKRQGFDLVSNTAEAVTMAYAYSKYLVIYAYLHDAETKGLGDTAAKARVKQGSENQKSIDYSEDEELKKNIGRYLQTQLGDRTGLQKLARNHNLNKELLQVMVEELASEGGTSLGAMLMKYKRKYKEEGDSHPLYGQASYDLDQESGTITNTIKWLNRILPKGCRYFDSDDPPPIGSFEERLRFFLYIHLTDKTREEAKAILKQADISERQMYIAIEEFTSGANTALLKVQWNTETSVREQFELVITRVADAKKMEQMLSICYLFFYRSSYRAAVESAVQTALMTGLYYNVFTTDILSKDDNLVLHELEKKMPLVPFLLNLMDQGSIMTLEEYEGVRKSKTLLVHKADMKGTIPWKPGTLVRTESGQISPYILILERNRNGDNLPKPTSLPIRLRQVEELTERDDLLFVIELTLQQKNQLHQILRDPNLEDNAITAMNAALSYWGYHTDF